MYEHVGLATLLLILALAGNLGDTEPPCCDPSLSVRPDVLLVR